MRLKQDPRFQEIRIILETSKDAMAMWELVDEIYNLPKLSQEAKLLAIKISNYFSTDAQLGGKS